MVTKNNSVFKIKVGESSKNTPVDSTHSIDNQEDESHLAPEI